MWSRRNVLAICGIFAVAIAVIVATALFARGGDYTASTTTTTESLPPPPNLDAMLLDRNTLAGIMGNVPLDNEFRQDFMSRPFDDSTSIPACRSVDGFADASLYADAPWRGVRVESFKQSDPASPQIIRQAVVWMPNAEAARELLKKASKEWGACKGKPFTAAGNRWITQDITDRPDMIIAVTRNEPPTDWSCQRALGIKGSFVAEGQVCGRGTGQAERVVQAILDKGGS